VGYIITGLKDIRRVQVGDTLCLASDRSVASPLPGFRKFTPYISIRTQQRVLSTRDFIDALEKLKLNDSSLTTQGISSPILGQRVKIGFLGMLTPKWLEKG
jgi:GTP-binding protein LepA